MPRGKRTPKTSVPVIIGSETNTLLEKYREELETNKEYSLEPDPTGFYKMGDQQKTIIKLYLEYRNLPMIGAMLNIDSKQLSEIFLLDSTQNELRRITKARYARQFTNKMMSIDQIAGWLSSLLIDENVPECDRLKTREKLEVAKLIISLNNAKTAAIDNPSGIMEKDFEEQVKDMSLSTIKSLLNNDADSSQKDKIVKAISDSQTSALLPEDIAYLRSLSYSELLQILKMLDKEEH